MNRRPATIAVLALLATGTLVPAARAQGHRSEFGTPAQQSKVRTRREVGLLPLQAACNVNTSRELFITDLTVVEDCYRTGFFLSCGTQVQPATRGAWTCERRRHCSRARSGSWAAAFRWWPSGPSSPASTAAPEPCWRSRSRS